MSKGISREKNQYFQENTTSTRANHRLFKLGPPPSILLAGKIKTALNKSSVLGLSAQVSYSPKQWNSFG